MGHRTRHHTVWGMRIIHSQLTVITKATGLPRAGRVLAWTTLPGGPLMAVLPPAVPPRKNPRPNLAARVPEARAPIKAVHTPSRVVTAWGPSPAGTALRWRNLRLQTGCLPTRSVRAERLKFPSGRAFSPLTHRGLLSGAVRGRCGGSYGRGAGAVFHGGD